MSAHLPSLWSLASQRHRWFNFLHVSTLSSHPSTHVLRPQLLSQQFSPSAWLPQPLLRLAFARATRLAVHEL
jgi:hypothetical protein